MKYMISPIDTEKVFDEIENKIYVKLSALRIGVIKDNMIMSNYKCPKIIYLILRNIPV